MDEIDSLQDVIAEQTSSAQAVAELSPPSPPPQPLARKAASSATTSQASQRTRVSEPLLRECLGLECVELGLADGTGIEQPLGLFDLACRAG